MNTFRIKLLMLALTFTFNAYAIEIKPWETPSKVLTCPLPTEYVSGSPIEADDILSAKLFVDGVDTGVTSQACRFVIDVTAITSGIYQYSVKASSAKYGTDSVLTIPPAELDILAREVPNAPSQLSWE